VQELQTVEVAAVDEPDGSVIWLHGLGADGHDFEAIVPQLRLPSELDLRFVFPHAPVRPVTLNGGMEMRAWFDFISLDRAGPVDEEGIRQSSAMLGSLVEREHERGVPYDRIVVAGFSQGGAIATHFALRFRQRLAGLMALSTYLPLQAERGNADSAQPRDLRIFMAHGSFDPVLPLQLGSESRDAIVALGYSVEWSEYPMPHAVCPQEIDDISCWLAGSFADDRR